MLHGVPPPGLKEKPWQDCPGGIDFTHPDFALTVRMTDANAGPSRFYYSTDRGTTWEGPFRLPLFGQKGIAARTDYLVNGKHDCTLFLTAAEAGRPRGPAAVRPHHRRRPDLEVRRRGSATSRRATPSCRRRSGSARTELLTAIRCREAPKSWIETYRSLDDGKTWKLDTVPVPGHWGRATRPSMIRLADGRVCLTYGQPRPAVLASAPG